MKLKFWTALSVAVLLLQGCSSPGAIPEEASPEAEESVVENKYNPKLSPAFSELWPTNVTRQELIETSLYKSFEFMDKVRVESCPVKANVFFGDSVLDEHTPIIEQISSEMNLVFCDYLTDDITVIAGNYEFLKSTVSAEGLPMDEFGGICGYEIGLNEGLSRGCAYQGVAWVGPGLGTIRMGEVKTDPIAVAIVSHEIIHLVQDSADPGQSVEAQGSGQNLFRPVWWVEGGGEFFGHLIPRYLDIQDYRYVTPHDRAGEALLVSYLSDLQLFEEWRQQAFGLENYVTGQIALEYITANVGLEAIMNLLVLMGEGEEFESAFESAVGLSVQDFYDKFAIMYANLYEGELAK